MHTAKVDRGFPFLAENVDIFASLTWLYPASILDHE